jgi:tripartite-type tricarboxylate transporter receptor subunit TctC
MSMKRRAFVTTSLAALAAPALAQSAEWPRERPVQVIVPFPPGGGVDQMARLVLPHVQKQLPDLRFVVDNRPGAASQLGLELLYGSRPDGYTIGAVVMPTLLSMALERTVRYDAKQFTFIANVVDDPGGLWVIKGSRVQSLAELIEKGKADKGAVSIGTTGVGSDDHLMIAALAQATGAQFNHVPFNGFAPLQTAVLGGHIDVGCFNMSEGLPGLRDGRLRCLGLASAQRLPVVSEVPTFNDQGIRMEAGSQRGIIGPPGMPADIRNRLVGAFEAALASAAFKAEAEKVDMPISAKVGDAYRQSVFATESQLQQMWERSPWRD